jgi:parvulin-like peptidyl-prolyl isomerase
MFLAICAPLRAQELLDIAPKGSAQESPDDAAKASAPGSPLSLDATLPAVVQPAPLTQADAANLDGCRVVARIDDQVILACDVLWRVNQLIETQKQRVGASVKVTPEQIEVVRQQLMKREVAALVDRKLLFNEFRRSVPPENLPRIEQSLQQPFEERELPQLMKQLHVENQRDLQHELARLGSSLADVQRTFNERVIASEWIHSKVKINEEISPDEMIEYYRAHLADYEYPTQARWEELAVRKDRFKQPREAYAALAQMGNDVWIQNTTKPVKGAAFANVAKARSDGFTAKKGGLYDWTTQGALQCKAIDKELFTLEVGQMSQILDSGPMFHIVRVLERKEAGRKSYTDVQPDIREKLKEQRFQAGAEAYLTRLRSEARIWTVYTGNVSAETLLGRKPGDAQQR